MSLTDGRTLAYDYLVIATGTSPRPDQTPGMLGARVAAEHLRLLHLRRRARRWPTALRDFDGGRLVVHITDMPIKCPVAPLEFTFLADAYFRERGMRDRVELVYVTPLSGAFTKPIASAQLGVDARRAQDRRSRPTSWSSASTRRRKTLVSYDEREIPFDLLVTVPLNMGADFVARSGLGDELNYVPVDKHTLQSKAYANIFAVGDATDIPTSKAGSVAHFSVEIFVRQLPATTSPASR